MLLDANRNGFFYVLDRSNAPGLITANPYVKVNWASGIDMKTGRPIETDISAKAALRRKGRGVALDLRRQELWSRRRSIRRTTPRLRQHALYRRALRKMVQADYKAGEWYVGMDLSSDLWEWPQEARGYLKAIDPMTGKTKWENESDIPRILRGVVDRRRPGVLRTIDRRIRSLRRRNR